MGVIIIYLLFLVENSLRDGSTKPPYLSLEKLVMQIKEQQLELDMEQQTQKNRHGSKLGKEYDKAVYCQPAYLTHIQSTSGKMPGWMNHKLESRLPGKISTTSDMQMI